MASGAPAHADDPYRSHDFDELCELPTVYAPGLLAGQVVLVTGAAGGIGTAISVLCGRLGARIVACGRSADKLDAWTGKLERAGIEATALPATVRDPDRVAAVVDHAYERFGRLDVVVNNAGGQFAAPALDITPKGWAAVVETNLYGTWYTMQAAARRWADLDEDAEYATAEHATAEHATAEHAATAPATETATTQDAPGAQRCIVNIATIIGRGGAGIAHTAAARAGAVNLSRYLAVEWAPLRIRVNAIAVGVIASEGLVNYPSTARASFGHNPMRRLGDVWDIAQGMVYLASPAAGFITGTTLEITGGEHVWGEYWPLGRPDWFEGEAYGETPGGADREPSA